VTSRENDQDDRETTNALLHSSHRERAEEWEREQQEPGRAVRPKVPGWQTATEGTQLVRRIHSNCLAYRFLTFGVVDP
jgi:hypothetical protein